jgi:extracellular factor (EF) 3-hydroxypalmitic acid methyl ester biosynthesis protein
VKLLRPIDAVVTFRNVKGDHCRATLANLQRRCVVMEVYNPESVIQLSDVLSDFTIRSADDPIYKGSAVVTSVLNAGLVAVISVALVDEWSSFAHASGFATRIGDESKAFVDLWNQRIKIRTSYQVLIGEIRSFLSELSRWLDQVDLTTDLPRDPSGRLREDVFQELAQPLFLQGAEYLKSLEEQAKEIPQDESDAHRAYAQSALHPVLFRAPFVYRTFTKPMGYAGDYEMVNQILGDPRQGESTYVQLVNTLFLSTAVAQAHRNRIDILVKMLQAASNTAQAGPVPAPLRILSVGSGPAIEVQRFVASSEHAERVHFTLMDFSKETLEYSRQRIDEVCRKHGKKVQVDYLHGSVHDLIKQASRGTQTLPEDQFDVIYCAGLFDYLSDKVCVKLIDHFASRCKVGGDILLTNVHSRNPEKFVMAHLLEWHLIYRDEQQMENLLPARRGRSDVYCDATGVNLFAQFQVAAR